MLRTEADEAAAAVRDRAASLAKADEDTDNIVIIVFPPYGDSEAMPLVPRDVLAWLGCFVEVSEGRSDIRQMSYVCDSTRIDL